MLSFSFTPFSSSVAVSRRLNLLSWFVSFYLSSYSFPQSVIAPVSSCSHLSLPFPTQHLFFLSPPPPRSLPLSVSEMPAQIQFKSYPEKSEQQDFVNGNLIHGEQGVCNAVHVPGSCLIAFGFVQICLLLAYWERKIIQKETPDSFFTMYFNLVLCVFLRGMFG